MSKQRQSKITWYIGEPSPHEKKNKELESILNKKYNINNNNDNASDNDLCQLVQNPVSFIYNSNCNIL